MQCTSHNALRWTPTVSHASCRATLGLRASNSSAHLVAGGRLRLRRSSSNFRRQQHPGPGGSIRYRNRHEDVENEHAWRTQNRPEDAQAAPPAAVVSASGRQHWSYTNTADNNNSSGIKAQVDSITAAEQEDVSGLSAVQKLMIHDTVAAPPANPDSLSFKARFQPAELASSAAIAVKQAVDVGLAALDLLYIPVEAALQKQQLQQQLQQAAAAGSAASPGAVQLQQASKADKVSSAAAELQAAADAASAAAHVSTAASTPAASGNASSTLAEPDSAEMGQLAASAARAASTAAAGAAAAGNDLQMQQPSNPRGSSTAAAAQLQDRDVSSRLIEAEQDSSKQQQQQQQHQSSTQRQARFQVAAGRLRDSWVASMEHLNQQREQAAQQLLRKSSEAKHAFNESAHEVYNEAGPPLFAGMVHLIGNRNAADLVAFLGRSNTATLVSKLGSSGNTAVLQEMGPAGTARVVGKLKFLGVVDLVQKLGAVGGAKLGYKMGRELAGKMDRKLQGVVDDAKEQLQRSNDSSSSSSSSSSAVLHSTDGRTDDNGVPQSNHDSEAAGGLGGVWRHVSIRARLAGAVVLLSMLRAAVAAWRLGAGCVVKAARAVLPGGRAERAQAARDPQQGGVPAAAAGQGGGVQMGGSAV